MVSCPPSGREASRDIPACYFCALGGIRTPNNWFEASRDIRFTTRTHIHRMQNRKERQIKNRTCPVSFVPLKKEFLKFFHPNLLFCERLQKVLKVLLAFFLFHDEFSSFMY